MDYIKAYESWLKDEYIDDETKEELIKIKDNDNEIKERFMKELEFGTGGLRGVVGAGTNRINVYTVRKATQGLANFLLKQDFGLENAKDKGVTLAYDSRKMSVEFAKEAALVLNANGIKTYLFESLRPTPVLSFAVRYLKCAGGIVITASHNPPEYNGYKVYGDDGGQIPYPKDNEVIKEVNAIKSFSDVKSIQEEEAKESGLFNIIGEEVDSAYIKTLKKQIINPEIIEAYGDKLNIIYTPLHGTGNLPVTRILSEAGFKNIYTVKEQAEPDGNFTTVGYPNPEDPKVFKLAIALSDKMNGDIIIATDPDADRAGIVCKKNNGEYMFLTGNMIGNLLTDYIISQMNEKGILPENSAVISTIVSSRLTKAIADFYGVHYFDVLTGFKYIGKKIREFEENNSYHYLFGFEESYGYLKGDYARDKDGVEAALIACEMAAFYKSKGMTLYDALENIYKKYGYYFDKVHSITLKGLEGLDNINKIMEVFRKDPPEEISEIKTISLKDYKLLKEYNLSNKAIEEIEPPASNVLYFTLEDGSWFCIRPSGTEPKIKLYIGVKSHTMEKSMEKSEKLFNSIMEKINKIIK
ncbi:phospho-sugar mutase [Anaeropeptidivorans aminofermentans]|uniref:phospho-sugar mutase n=1 Tax=Anaeropeptidivorans aminofermentans TaxID=2934315 RepID=UPI002023EED3|nr:phospho-sugar mutase [Anaeropeptidivorans aminofermentans]